VTLETDEKRFLALRNGLWAVGIIVVGGIVAAALRFNSLQNETNAISSQVQGLQGQVSQIQQSLSFFAIGDTPVVLIGGSVDLQTGSKTTWKPDPNVPGGYYASGENSIGTISIKNALGDTEFTTVMTNGESLEVMVVSNQVKAITVSQAAKAAKDPTIHVALVTPAPGTLNSPSATMLHYHKRGMECPGGRDNCDNLETVSVTVNNISRGTFTCTNGPPTPSVPNPVGKCRVAFIEGK
jgi:hypothetical protein